MANFTSTCTHCLTISSSSYGTSQLPRWIYETTYPHHYDTNNTHWDALNWIGNARRLARSNSFCYTRISSRMWRARRILGMISKARRGGTLHLLAVSWASGTDHNLLIVWTHCLEFSLAVEDTLVEGMLWCTVYTARMEHGIQWTQQFTYFNPTFPTWDRDW